MATNKLAMKFRSITYPNHEASSQKKHRKRLQRMQSFDFSQNEPSTVPVKSSVSRREVSAEGRLRAQQFQDTHTVSANLAPGQKLLRFSDECWCSPAGEQLGRPHPATAGCLTSPKSKPGAAVRLGVTNVERLVDWQRQSPEKHIVSSNSQDHSQRHSRSKERRSDRDSTSSERRSHYCASVSLPPPTKSPEQNTAANATTTTTATSESRGRRSQFRRAWSLFSLTCDKEVERREKSPQQRILRPPTRHFYRRGLSGLPIECSTRYLGLAY
ncbi:uncharacterized protein [Procambarus clarkii]|uniref:uncharacterized protein n=1 Tax=Procambarus clarkii TaxID=6728 RepID=UPI001E67644F|nr:uncharacterized protein LOC123764952 [Procambarus clarkii]